MKALFIDYAIMTYMSRFFNTIEAAARLRVSESTVRRLFLRHQLQGVKVGRALRFTEADILTFIDRHREQVEPEQQTIILSPQAPKISFT
jgi:excisionase family DNA binding protein